MATPDVEDEGLTLMLYDAIFSASPAFGGLGYFDQRMRPMRNDDRYDVPGHRDEAQWDPRAHGRGGEFADVFTTPELT